LEKYFSKPLKGDRADTDRFMLMVYILTIAGVLAIPAGIVQLNNGDYSYGLGAKYLVPVIREGGYKVILGIIMLVGGLIRINHERKKKIFIEALLNKNSTWHGFAIWWLINRC
jgi:hypothetical protein